MDLLYDPDAQYSESINQKSSWKGCRMKCMCSFSYPLYAQFKLIFVRCNRALISFVAIVAEGDSVKIFFSSILNCFVEKLKFKTFKNNFEHFTVIWYACFTIMAIHTKSDCGYV